MKQEKYVDGFVIVVPKEKLSAYKKDAKFGAKLWMKYGALDYKECIGDDLNAEWIKFTFPKMTKLKEDEVVVFSYITFESKAHRNKVNKLVMSDPSMQGMEDKEMPMDMKRFAYGGFKIIVDGKKN